MSRTIDFYWDIGSTNSYFALHLIKPIAAKHGAKVAPHPFNLGYVFRKHHYVLMEEPKAKIANRIVDLGRWATRYNLPFKFPSAFPIKTSRALRAALAARRLGCEWEFMEKMFAAYWEQNDESIADYAGLRRIAVALALDPDAFETSCESADVRDELAAETDAGLSRGVFGAPSFLIGDELFWGKDRMEFIDAELAKGP